MGIKAHGDFETRHVVDLKVAGAEVVFEDENTGVWMLAWVLGDNPRDIAVWTPNDPDPDALLEHVAKGGTFGGHNVGFEWVVWNRLIRGRLRPNWPELRHAQLDCTMARALAHGLPGKLETLAEALHLDVAKDKEGAALMLRMARPRDKAAMTWWDVPERVQRLAEYCVNDVRVELAIDAVLPPLTPSEHALWQHTLAVNERGIALDLRSIDYARGIVAAETQQLDLEAGDLSGGMLSSARQSLILPKWLAARGIEAASVAKDAIPALVSETVERCDADAYRMLAIRGEISKASTAKLEAMTEGTNRDGRSRGLLAYHGAATGRWSGRRWQPHNLPRLKDTDGARQLVELMPLDGAQEAISALFGSPMQAIAGSLRAMLVPAEGKVFVGADLANIEGRVLAWLAGEEWKLEAFRAYDAGTGPDLYKLAYARSFGKLPEDVTSEERQIGKVQELALGYQGGHNAFKTMGRAYGLTVLDGGEELAPGADWRTLTWRQTNEIKRGWRAAHPAVVQFWYDLERAAIDAIEDPKHTTTVGGIAYRRARLKDGLPMLLCRLPSGRVLHYAEPSVVQVEVSRPKLDEDGRPVLGEDGKPIITKRWRSQIRYMGLELGRWKRCAAYGGLLAENVTQAVARDILAGALLRLERAGYPVTLHVHDEVLLEVPAGTATKDELARITAIINRVPGWAHGLPVACKAWTDNRYLKD